MIENLTQIKDEHIIETFGEIKMTQKSYMIIDMQYGSTGKGLLAGYLAEKYQPDVVVTAWGPNAGHTYINSNGRKFVHRMLANGIVSPALRAVLIGPGSVIDLDCLQREILDCKDLMKGKVVVIHPHAVIVGQKHRETEARNVKIGSTMKGTGAAVIQRIERDPDNSVVACDNIPNEFFDKLHFNGIECICSDSLYQTIVKRAKLIQIEGAQGFSLSMYHGFYPYTTSRDVTPAQVMADCALPIGLKPLVYGTLRTFPIRVANRYDEDGKQLGTSGPFYRDQKELEWSDIGLEPELTTVTKLPRRIFSFSRDQLRHAMHYCAPDKVFLNFANYLTDHETLELIDAIESEHGEGLVEWVGTGPGVDDVFESSEWYGVEEGN
jgi:adenylosuccinate synthase